MAPFATVVRIKRQYTDSQYIDGLKRGCPAITRSFFYDLCRYALTDIRYTLMRRAVDYDELVGELYVYLSERQWYRLDSFSGLNGCSLRTWMSRLAWRFFMQQRQLLMVGAQADAQNQLCIQQVTPMADAEISLDIESTLRRMPNQRYAHVLRLMLLQEYSAEDVADMMHTTVSNVYNIKHRAIIQFIKTYAM